MKKSPQKLIDVFYKLLPARPDVERRNMFGYPCAFANGQLFVGLHQDNMVLKLADKER